MNKRRKVYELENKIYREKVIEAIKRINSDAKIDIREKLLFLNKQDIAKCFNCKEEEIAFGDVNFEDMDITICPYKFILGNAYFKDSKITNFDKLQVIFGDVVFSKIKLKSIKNLQYVGGNFEIIFSEINDLGNLRYVNGNLNIFDSKIINLGSLQYSNKDVYISYSEINDLGNLRYINGNLNIFDSKIIDLDSLQYIEDDANISCSKIINLGNIQYIGGNICTNTEILICKCKKIGFNYIYSFKGSGKYE